MSETRKKLQIAREFLKRAADVSKEKCHAAGVSVSAFLADNEFLKGLEKVTQSAATSYDKALDKTYLETHVRGGDHRLFDGGHDLMSAWQRVRDASESDTFAQEVAGYASALWKDVTTLKGLPFATLEKGTFEGWVNAASGWIPGIDRKYLYDLVSYDAGEILGATLGTVAAVMQLKAGDRAKLSEILGSMGICSVISANPVMGVVAIAVTAYAYKKKQITIDPKEALKGGSMYLLSAGLFSVMGFPILLEVVLVAVLTTLFRKHVLTNEQLQEQVSQQLKKAGVYSAELSDRIVSGVSAALKKAA